MLYQIIYIALGLCAGFCSGLFGIGGGVIIVPAFLLLFTQQGIPAAHLSDCVLSSSLAILFLISLNSARQQIAVKNYHWPSIGKFLPVLGVGLCLGIWGSHQLAVNALEVALASFLALLAGYIFYSSYHPATPHPIALHYTPQTLLLMLGIGIQTGLFGLGGGVFLIPFFVYHGFNLRLAVGTSTLGIAMLAGTGVCIHLWQHPNAIAEIPYSWGSVLWPVVVVVTLASLFSTGFGVRMAHSLSERKLKTSFSVLLFLVSLKLLVKHL